MSILSLRNVTYHYPGAERPALDDVSLDVQAGEFCLLAGLSGHGKSTLLRAACGLVPHFHGGRFAGRVALAGLDTREHGPARLGTFAGALFQDPETQLVMSSVRAELALALESRGHGAGAVARGVEEVALALGVDHLLDRSTHDLSGGEKQRVALGAALAARPPVLLLDEPTSQLDPVAGDELIGLLRRLNQEWDTAILLAEHRLERCLPSADRVIALRDGRLAYDGEPRAFLEWAASESPALQTPGARLFALAGLAPPPVGVKQARATLRRCSLLSSDSVCSTRPPANLLSREDNRGQGAISAASATFLAPTVPAGPAATAIPAALVVPPGPLASVPPSPPRWGRRGRSAAPALQLHGVWYEIRRGPAILRGADLRIEAGESLALMGRNGAGKSTLLRHAAGLLEPTRGRIERAGRVALLLQNPGDYFIHDRLDREASPRALALAGLAELAARNPRDLSGGERQRLALAIVTDGGEGAGIDLGRGVGIDLGEGAGIDLGRGVGIDLGEGAGIDLGKGVGTDLGESPGCDVGEGLSEGVGEGPAVLALDEPTRGMDRLAKAQLAAELRRRAQRGQAVIVATHDPEFACACAERAVLLADGRVIADGPAHELLAGGWYFATETARILGGAGGALRPEEGAELLAGRSSAARPPLELAG